MSGRLPGLVISHLYLRFVMSLPIRLVNATDPEAFFQSVLDFLLNPAVLIGGTVIFFLVFSIVWVLSTVGEAALIRGVADFDDGRSRSIGELFSSGARLLVRFIAIDTVIFFPFFLILLIEMLIVGGGLIGSILFLIRPGVDPNDLVPIGIVVGLITLFLAVLSVPVLLVTTLFRLLAFRIAALEDLPTRPSIRRAWQIIRGKIGPIAVIFLLLYAVSYGVGMLTSIIVTPVAIGGSFFFMGPLMQGQIPQQGNVDAFLLLVGLVSLIAIIPGLLYRVFYSAVWTLAYREWQISS